MWNVYMYYIYIETHMYIFKKNVLCLSIKYFIYKYNYENINIHANIF